MKLGVRSGYRGYDIENFEFNTLPIYKSWTEERAIYVSQTSNCPKLDATEDGMIYDLYGEASADAVRGEYEFTVSHKVVEVGGFA